MSARIYRRFLIILLLSLIFIIEIGYASFSTGMDYTDYSGDSFDVRFENAEIINSVGVDLEGTTIEVSPGGKYLNVNVSNLQYPGAGIEFSVDVVNRGECRAKVESIIPCGLEESRDIKVNILDEENINEIELDPNESHNIHFTVVWDYNCTKEIKDVKEFRIVINYKQAL